MALSLPSGPQVRTSHTPAAQRRLTVITTCLQHQVTSHRDDHMATSTSSVTTTPTRVVMALPNGDGPSGPIPSTSNDGNHSKPQPHRTIIASGHPRLFWFSLVLIKGVPGTAVSEDIGYPISHSFCIYASATKIQLIVLLTIDAKSI